MYFFCFCLYHFKGNWSWSRFLIWPGCNPAFHRLIQDPQVGHHHAKVLLQMRAEWSQHWVWKCLTSHNRNSQTQPTTQLNEQFINTTSMTSARVKHFSDCCNEQDLQIPLLCWNHNSASEVLQGSFTCTNLFLTYEKFIIYRNYAVTARLTVILKACISRTYFKR